MIAWFSKLSRKYLSSAIYGAELIIKHSTPRISGVFKFRKKYVDTLLYWTHPEEERRRSLMPGDPAADIHGCRGALDSLFAEAVTIIPGVVADNLVARQLTVEQAMDQLFAWSLGGLATYEVIHELEARFSAMSCGGEYLPNEILFSD